MSGVKRALKFQTNMFLGNFIKAISIATIAVTGMILITFLTGNLDIKTFIDSNAPINSFFLILGMYLATLSTVSIVALVIHCFTSLYTDFKFNLRLGVTRKEFFISNFLFFTLTAIVFIVIGFSVSYFYINASGIANLDGNFNLTSLNILKAVFLVVINTLSTWGFFAGLVFLIQWKVIGLVVLHSLLYNFIQPYTAIVDITIDNMNVPSQIGLYLLVHVILFLIITKYNDVN